jgi:hypothetical protein
MGIMKQAKADSMATKAKVALGQGHKIFVVQLRGGYGHTPALSRPVQDVAEQIEAIEAAGWRLDHMESLLYKNNLTTVCLFRPQPAQRPPAPQQQVAPVPPGHAYARR